MTHCWIAKYYATFFHSISPWIIEIDLLFLCLLSFSFKTCLFRKVTRMNRWFEHFYIRKEIMWEWKLLSKYMYRSSSFRIERRTLAINWMTTTCWRCACLCVIVGLLPAASRLGLGTWRTAGNEVIFQLAETRLNNQMAILKLVNTTFPYWTIENS